MASTGIVVLHKTLLLPISTPKCCKNQISPLKTSQFLSSNSLLVLKKSQIRLPSVHIKQLKNHRLPVISAAQSNLFKGTLLIFGPENWGNFVSSSLMRLSLMPVFSVKKFLNFWGFRCMSLSYYVTQSDFFVKFCLIVFLIASVWCLVIL